MSLTLLVHGPDAEVCFTAGTLPAFYRLALHLPGRPRASTAVQETLTQLQYKSIQYDVGVRSPAVGQPDVRCIAIMFTSMTKAKKTRKWIIAEQQGPFAVIFGPR